MSQLPLEIAAEEVQALREAGEDFLLLDCREVDEHAVARIEGAMLLPMSEIAWRVAALDSHRQRRIIVHCHLGQRSAQVAQWLAQQGFAAVQNMSGGIDAWSVRVDPDVPRY